MPGKENEIPKNDEPIEPQSDKEQELSEQELDQASGGTLRFSSPIVAKITPSINFSVFRNRADCW